MEERFEEWLRKDDLFEYYHQNPSQQEGIFKDYLHERAFSDIDSWIEWVICNPELAEERFPELIQGKTERIKRRPPFFAAVIIQKLPESFPKQIAEIEKQYGQTKQKSIQRQIDLINLVTERDYGDEIIERAVESVRDELVEQKQFWENALQTVRKSYKAPNTKKIFKPEAIPKIFKILKDHFPEEQQDKLKKILEEGGDADQPLYFKDDGKRLVYYFRQLQETDIITGYNKTELNKWICRNFVYKKNKSKAEAAIFKPKYVETILTGADERSRNPLPLE